MFVLHIEHEVSRQPHSDAPHVGGVNLNLSAGSTLKTKISWIARSAFGAAFQPGTLAAQTRKLQPQHLSDTILFNEFFPWILNKNILFKKAPFMAKINYSLLLLQTTNDLCSQLWDGSYSSLRLLKMC